MDQFLSLLSRGKLSKKEGRKADEGGTNRASWELRRRAFS